MTEAVYQFKSIKRILDRQEQKADFEEKNPPIPDTSMYGWWAAPQCKRPTTDLAEWVKPFCAKTNLRSVVGDLRTELDLLERLERAVIKI
jgi:hypothetical protein